MYAIRSYYDTREVGKPEVPLKGVLLDIPQDKTASLSVLQTEVDSYSGYQIFPVPQQVVDDQGSTAARITSYNVCYTKLLRVFRQGTCR